MYSHREAYERVTHKHEISVGRGWTRRAHQQCRPAHPPQQVLPGEVTDDTVARELAALATARQARATAVAHRRAVRASWNAARPACGPILASLRRASQLTQAQTAEILGVTQSTVATLEGQDSMRLSTLSTYLRAIGADRPHLVVTLDTTEFVIPL